MVSKVADNLQFYHWDFLYSCCVRVLCYDIIVQACMHETEKFFFAARVKPAVICWRVVNGSRTMTSRVVDFEMVLQIVNMAYFQD